MDVKRGPQTKAQMRRAPEQARSRDRVEQILAAATELIRLTGSEQMTMSAIAKKAGMSLPSIYRYFPDKSALIQTLANQYMALVRVGIEQALAGVDGPKEARVALRSMIRTYWLLYRSEPAYRDVLTAMQADRRLALSELEDSRTAAALLDAKLHGLVPVEVEGKLDTLTLLGTHLTAAVMRLALLTDESEGEALVEAWIDIVCATLLDSKA